MLSIAKLTSSGGAASYFEVDDYYSKEEAEKILKETTFWHGSLKKELNLPDHVDKKDFKNLLDGNIIKKIITNNEVLQKLKQHSSKDGSSIRSPGTDLTFSAPKSLSILSEAFGKKELSKMHDEAVKNTLDYVEKNFINTQIRQGSSSDKNSTVELDQTAKALFATFKHNTSRNLDPQLHTHAVAINVTRIDKETKYRSTEFKKIFENKMLLGAIYRSELSSQLIKNGYEVEQNHTDGRFEIKSFPQKLIDKFSTRRKEIEQVLEKLSVNDAKTSAKVTLKTRNRKIDTRKESLEKTWSKTTKDYDVSKIQNQLTTNGIKKDLPKSFEKSISVLIERNSLFTKNDLVKQILTSNIENGIVIKEVEKEFTKMVEDKKLLNIRGDFYSTQQELNRELAIIKSIKDIKDDKQIFRSQIELNQNIVKDKDLQERFNKFTEGQQRALNHILTSKEQLIGIQGSAGTGKTYMLSLAKDLLQKKGYEFIGLAPSSSASKLLKDEINIKEANTLQHFLTRYSRFQDVQNINKNELLKTQNFFKNKVMILDEASLVSNKQMLNLISITKNLDTKLILQGDKKQLSAIEAGKPFHQMQEVGLNTAVMSDILRQRNHNLKEVVNLTIQDNIQEAFEKIKDNIIDLEAINQKEEKDKEEEKLKFNHNSYTNEKPDKEFAHKLEESKEKKETEIKSDLVSKTIETYFSLSPKQRGNTLVLTPANETRKELNSKIREELINRKELDQKTNIQINTLKSKNLGASEKLLYTSYEKSDIVVFNKDYKSLGIIKDQELEVISRDKQIIHLKNQNNDNLKIDLSKLNPKTINIYQAEQKEVLKNEKIRFTKNDKSLKLINSHTAEVLNINNKEENITLKLDTGKNVTVPTADLKHFDYAYSSTAYSAQGKTANNVIAVLESYRKNLTNQQTFYVEISRARDNAFLITDSKEKLLANLEKHTGQKLSAISDVKRHNQEASQQQATINNSTITNDNSKEIKREEIELRD